MAGPVTLENLDNVIQYHAPTTADLQRLENIRLACRQFCRAILQNAPECADRSAALRHAREAMMSANASVVLGGLV